MQDLIYVLVTIAFFVLMAGLVIGCERIVGDDDAGAVPGGEMPTQRDASVSSEVPA